MCRRSQFLWWVFFIEVCFGKVCLFLLIHMIQIFITDESNLRAWKVHVYACAVCVYLLLEVWFSWSMQLQTSTFLLTSVTPMSPRWVESFLLNKSLTWNPKLKYEWPVWTSVIKNHLDPSAVYNFWNVVFWLSILFLSFPCLIFFQGAILSDPWGGAVAHAECVESAARLKFKTKRLLKAQFSTDLGSDSFAQVNGIFKPLLSSWRRRVSRTSPQVRTDRRHGPSGRGLSRSGGLRTLLLGNGVLKHTLINCRWKEKVGD